MNATKQFFHFESLSSYTTITTDKNEKFHPFRASEWFLTTRGRLFYCISLCVWLFWLGCFFSGPDDEQISVYEKKKKYFVADTINTTTTTAATVWFWFKSERHNHIKHIKTRTAQKKWLSFMRSDVIVHRNYFDSFDSSVLLVLFCSFDWVCEKLICLMHTHICFYRQIYY